MAAMMTVTCDRCRRTIEADRHLLRIESGTLRGRRSEVDLCTVCAAGFLEWIDRHHDDDDAGRPRTARDGY